MATLELFQVLNEIGEILNTSLDNQVLFKKTLEKCMKFTNSDKGSIIKIDNEKNTLDIVYQVGLGSKVEKNTKLKIGEGITGLSVKERRVICVGDVTVSSDYISVNSDIKSEMAIPIINKNLIYSSIYK